MRLRIQPWLRKERGSFLVVTFLFLAILTAWSAANMQRGLVQIRAAHRYIEKLQANQLAESALDQAILQVAASNTTTIALTTLGSYGSYGASITDNGSNYTITATGVNTDVTQQVEAVVSVTPPTLFTHAAFADSAMTVRGITDSYDACAGAYDPSSAGSNGDVGTNGTGSKAIDLKTGSYVNGNVDVGEGLADPTDAISGSLYSGTASSQTSNKVLEAVASPGGTCTSLEVKNSDTYTLYEAFSPYCFTDVQIHNSATLNVSGSVVVYVDEFQTDNSATINPGGLPSNLAILVYSDHDVQIKNSGGFYGTIYAPESDFDIDNSAQVYGALIGGSIDFKNATYLHYDTCLDGFNPLGGDTTPEILAWRDL